MSEDKTGGRLARKLGTVAAVVATGFLCGWSAMGRVAGVVLAVALGAGAAPAVFGNKRHNCLPRFRRWR